jgi:hypothetical protein
MFFYVLLDKALPRRDTTSYKQGDGLMLRAAVKLLGKQAKRPTLILQDSDQSDEDNQVDGAGGVQDGN